MKARAGTVTMKIFKKVSITLSMIDLDPDSTWNIAGSQFTGRSPPSEGERQLSSADRLVLKRVDRACSAGRCNH
jgi:hypothetical protein